MGALFVFGVGLMFGVGLVVSGMIYPQKVIAFLDVTGQWDPSLAFVMGGAVATHFVGRRLVLKKVSPSFASSFALPKRTDVDARLVTGAALFGVGWGWIGLCPGPALAGLTLAPEKAGIFVASMLAGMALWGFFDRRWAMLESRSN